MHVPKLLLSILSWASVAFCASAAPQPTYDGPQTVEELRDALKRLGIKGADSIPVPSSLIESRAATVPSRLCIATVSAPCAFQNSACLLGDYIADFVINSV